MTCGGSLSVLVDNVELVKAIMQAPALILRNGGKLKVLNCSGEEVALPSDIKRCLLLFSLFYFSNLCYYFLFRIPVITAFEMMCVNINSEVFHYKLRKDGVVVFTGQVNP
jgi:hypothetical protein